MKKIFLTVLFCIAILMQSQGQQYVKLFGENDGKTVKLMWFVSKYPADFSGFDVKRRSQAGAEWQKLNTLPVVPEVAAGKKLDNVEPDTKERAKLAARLTQALADKKLKATDAASFKQRLLTDTGASLVLTLLFSGDFQLAQLTGFGLADRSQPGGSLEYGLFFAGQNEPIATWNTVGETYSLKRERVEISFKPNPTKTALTLTIAMSEQQLLGGGYAGVHVYRKNLLKSAARKMHQGTIWLKAGRGNYNHLLVDETIKKDSIYSYEVVPVSIFGTEGAATQHLYDPGKYAGEIKPPALSQNGKTTDMSGLALTWDFDKTKEKFIAGFVLERKTNIDSGYVAVSGLLPANARSFKDGKNLEFQNYYFYRLKVEVTPTEDYQVPVYGNEILVYYQPELKPGRVTGVHGTLVTVEGKRFVSLRWNKNTDASTVGYRIYASFPPRKTLAWQADLPAITGNEYLYPVHNYAAATYLFSIAAISRFEDESRLSDTISVKSPASVVPNIQIWPFRVDSNQITLEWNYTTTPDLKGYRIYQDGKLVADENTVPADRKKLILPNLAFDMTYTFEMESVTNTGVLSRRSYPLTVTTDLAKKSAANK